MNDVGATGANDPTPPGPGGTTTTTPRLSGGSTVTYLGHEGRRFGAFEIEVEGETWAFPRDREVRDVPQKVVDALEGLDGNHDFKISKGV